MPTYGGGWERRANEAIAGLGSALAQESGRVDAFGPIVRTLEHFLEPAALAVFRASEAKDALELVEHRGLPPDAADRLRTVPFSIEGPLGEAARRRQVEVAERTAAPDGGGDEMMRAHPTAGAAIALPFVLRGRVLGATEMVIDRGEPLSPEAIASLATLARFAGVALGEALSRQSAQTSASRVERAQMAEKAVIESLSVLPEQQLQAAVRRGFYVWPQYLETTVPEFVADVIQHVVDEARELVGAEIGAIGVGDQPDRPFSPWAFSGVSRERFATVGRTPRPVGTLGVVACTGQIVRVRDVREHPSFRGLPPGHPPVVSLLGVPIRYRGQSLGNLYLANKIGAEEFSVDDQRAVEALADQAGVALQQGVLQASIEAQRAQTQSLLDSAPHGILFVDGQTRHVTANPSAMRLLGETISPEAGIEQYIGRLRYPDGRPVPLESTPAFRALQGEEHPTEQFVIVRRDGTQIPVIDSAAPVRGFGRKLLGAVVNFEDVSAVRDVEQMRNLERVREEFNATVAHDLRNPVQTVLAQIFLLLRNARGEDVTVPVQALRRIERSALALGRMAAALLDVSRIELKRVEIHPERAHLPDVTRDLLDRMRPSLAAEGHDIVLSIEDRPPAVDLDSFAFELILSNLVDNAAKFSPKGAPIRVAVRSSEGGGLVSVLDRGPGISEEDRAHLFDRFYQARLARQKRTGLGLGLFIVKGYVDAHGGRVSVESEPGRGSTFSVWFPRSPSAHDQASAPVAR